MSGDKFRDLIFERTKIPSEHLSCPRAKSFMTPCVARDGNIAVSDDGKCIGCGQSVEGLIKQENNRIDGTKPKVDLIIKKLEENDIV